MTHPLSLIDTIIARERKVWDALIAGDATADARALADDFLGVYPDGFAQKVDHVGQLADGPTILNYALTEPRLLELAEGVALLSYKAAFHRVSSPQQEIMFVTSIWSRTGGVWRNIFSQDTPV